MTVRVSGRIVTPAGVLPEGCVEIRDGMITAVAEYPTARAGHWVLPGFVDMHVHGGGGHSFTTGDAEQARGAAEFHLGHGTTSLLASLVSAPFELMREATAAFAPLVADGIIDGLHFEGPYLSQRRCGAQNPAHLRDASLDELGELIALGAGAVRMVTLAPERPGALAAIELLAANGVVAAIGHSDAGYEQTLAAVEAGATVATHLFNAMPAVHHREPGPVLALLSAPSVICELIADGVHLHDGTLTFATTVAGPDRSALVTDAMAAAGMTDGAYELGGQAVTVTDGVARLTDSGAIAGSTLTLDAALRRALATGIDIVDAARMVATTPARAIGLAGRGALVPGYRADLVVCDEEFNVVRVMRAGSWVG